MRTELLLALVLLVGGCPPPLAVGGLETLPEFSAAQRERAWEHAPDLSAEAELALERASRAPNTAAREEWRMSARLLLEAAVAEATRVEEVEALRRARVETVDLEAAAATDDAARVAMLAEARDARAARVALDSAQRALRYAAEYEARHSRRTRGVEPRERASAVAILRERAELFVLAARAMGLEPAELGDAEAALAELEAAPDARELHAALAAEEAGLAALGEARRRREVDAAMIQSLSAEAETRGLNLELEEGGAHLRGELSRARLSALLAAFPHGPVVIFGGAAQRRALRRSLAEELSARLEEREAPELEILLPAYGP